MAVISKNAVQFRWHKSTKSISLASGRSAHSRSDIRIFHAEVTTQTNTKQAQTRPEPNTNKQKPPKLLHRDLGRGNFPESGTLPVGEPFHQFVKQPFVPTFASLAVSLKSSKRFSAKTVLTSVSSALSSASCPASSIAL